MNRRDIFRALASVAPLSVLGTSLRAQRRIRYEVHGAGPTLMIGSPITPSSPEAIRTGYLSRLTDRYRVVLIDYPSRGEEASTFTPDRVSTDILTVADEAGVEQFAWYGFSWGGVVGLQLAARSNRLTALICGGWPPLGAPYTATLAATENLASSLPDAQMAARASVLGLVMKQGLQLTIIGVLFGLAGAFGLSGLIASLLYDVAPTDPTTMAAVIMTISLAATVASALPAWRASRLDPNTALREE